METTTPIPVSIEEAKLLVSFSSTACAQTAESNTTKMTELALVQAAARCVDHSYTDHSNIDKNGEFPLTKENRIGPTVNKLLDMNCLYGSMKGKGRSSSIMMRFPCKLLEVLDRGDLTFIIDWMPHGRAFIVKQHKAFTTQVLPRFSKHTKSISFTHLLNLWSFKRITRGLDQGAYYHELFLPGRLDLIMRMKRQKIKGTGFRLVSNPDQEPNFYHQYPHVERVPRSRVAIPLSPLSCERNANLMHAGGGVGGGDMNVVGQNVVHHKQPALVGSQSLVPQQAATLGSNLGNGLDRNSSVSAACLSMTGLEEDAATPPIISSNKLDAMSAATTAEFRPRGSMEIDGLLPSASSSSSMMGVSNGSSCSNNTAFPDSSSSSSRTAGISSASILCLRRPGISVHADEAYSANHQTTCVSTPVGMPHQSTLENMGLHRSSPYDLHEASLLGRTSMAPSTLVRRESFHIATAAATANATIPNISSFSTNATSITIALREAQLLEKMAQSKRAEAWALVGALQIYLVGSNTHDGRNSFGK